jgi:hypothetical protein
LFRYGQEHCDQCVQSVLEQVHALLTVCLPDRLCGSLRYRYSTEVQIRLCAVHMLLYELVTY